MFGLEICLSIYKGMFKFNELHSKTYFVNHASLESERTVFSQENGFPNINLLHEKDRMDGEVKMLECRYLFMVLNRKSFYSIIF